MIPRTFALVPWLLLVSCTEDAGDDGTQSYCESCNLDGQIPLVAAEGATDCGEVEVGADPSTAAACIEQALAAGTPFTARQWLQGIDSTVIIGYVVDSDGEVLQLSYDSNICGAAECEAGCGPRVSSAVCGNARVGAMPADALVDCDLGATSTRCEPPM